MAGRSGGPQRARALAEVASARGRSGDGGARATTRIQYLLTMVIP